MHRLITYIALCTVILIAGCGGNNILRNADTSASHIDMNLNISIGEDGKNFLQVVVLQNDTSVAMEHGETMECNTIMIERDPDHTGFWATDFPLATPTTPITCQYSSTSAPVSFTFIPIPPPQLLTPLPSTHDHTQPLDINFTPINGSQVQAKLVVAVNGKNQLMDTKTQADTGHLSIDVHTLQGTGKVQLLRFQESHPSNSGFHSLAIYLDTTTSIPIILS